MSIYSQPQAQWALEQWERGRSLQEIRDALGLVFCYEAEKLVAIAIDLNAGGAARYRDKVRLLSPPTLIALLRRPK